MSNSPDNELESEAQAVLEGTGSLNSNKHKENHLYLVGSFCASGCVCLW